MSYSKINGVWRNKGNFLNQENVVSISLPRRFPSALALRPELGPTRPGSHYTKEGFVQVPPPSVEASFLTIDFRGDYGQMDIFHQDPNFLKPAKKNSVTGRRPRYTQLTVDLGAMMSIDSIMVPHDGSAVRIFSQGNLVKPKKSVAEHYYNRSKNRKVLTKLVQHSELPEHNIASALRLFTRVLGVDTNTFRHSSGLTVSVTAACLLELENLSSTETMFQATFHEGFVFFDVTGNPEVRGWIELIRRLLPPAEEESAHRIAIVVDSELRNLEGYQERTTAFSGNLFLPSCFDILYATDSSGRDSSPVNKLMATCHQYSKLASKKLKRVPMGELKGATNGVLDLSI